MAQHAAVEGRLVQRAAVRRRRPQRSQSAAEPHHGAADRPPTVELLKPAPAEFRRPGSDVPVMIRAGDDHGIDRLRLEMKVKRRRAAQAASESRRPTRAGHGRQAMDRFRRRVDHHRRAASRPGLKPESVKPGQTVLIRAVAWDKRAVSDWGLDLRPQETASGWHAVKIVAEDAKASAALEQLESLRGAIWKILEKQIHARMRRRRAARRPRAACRTQRRPPASDSHAADRNPEGRGRPGQVDRPDRPRGAAVDQARPQRPGLRRHASGRGPVRRADAS